MLESIEDVAASPSFEIDERRQRRGLKVLSEVIGESLAVGDEVGLHRSGHEEYLVVLGAVWTLPAISSFYVEPRRVHVAQWFLAVDPHCEELRRSS